MIRRFWTLPLAISASLGLAVGLPPLSTGGILKFFHRDSPASMSIHEEATISTVAPMTIIAGVKQLAGAGVQY
jgi:hypothetical protein